MEAEDVEQRRDALSWACWWGSLAVVERMLQHYPEDGVAMADELLTRTLGNGQELVAHLLLAQLPPESVKASVRSSLAEACRKRHGQIALLLIKRYSEETKLALGHPDAYDSTFPLYWACRHGLVDVVQQFLKNFPQEVQAALHLEDSFGKTPLAWACTNEHDRIVELLFRAFPGQVASEPELEPPAPLYPDAPEMLRDEPRETLSQQGYRIVGSHSAVKQCRWTKNAIRGEGQCYKHTFYGINSHQCMEGTPSLACANKCTFCWRNHANPVATSWDFQADDPEWLVEESLQNHLELVAQASTSALAVPSRVQEARQPRHMALSLVGEPVLYPEIRRFIDTLHKRRISTFLVTNGQFPDQLEELPWVTQLYVSVDAPDADVLKEVGRPLFRDYWERLRRSLSILKAKGPLQRTVCRMTCLKDKNATPTACEGYAELIKLSDCDFVEVKGATYSTWDKRNTGLSFDNAPWHEDVKAFANRLATYLPGYAVACEHEHSCAVLLARKDRFLDPTGRWRTWIDFEKFADAAIAGNRLEVTDFNLETPGWALADEWEESGAREAGFSPADRRRFRRGQQKRPTESEFLAARRERRALKSSS